MALSFDRSNPGVWLSAAAHIALLTAGLVAFTAEKLPEAQEGIPVEILTDNQVSEITRGETTAAKVQPTPSPRVDRQAETRVERDPGEAKQDVPSPPKRPIDVKVADDEAEPAPAPTPPKKPEVAKAEPPPPPPPSRPDTARAEAAAAEAQRAADAAKAASQQAAQAARQEAARAEAAKAEAQRLALRQEAEEAAREEKQEAERARAEAKAKTERAAAAAAAAKARAEAAAKAEAERRIQEAELKEKAEAEAKAKAEARRKLAEARARADAKAKAEAEARARRQAEAADQFSPGDISRLLASKAPSQSSGATGREVQKTASLGTAAGTAQRLNPSQRDQIAGLIREQLIRCWQPPVAVQSAPKPPTAVIRLGLKQDGSLSAEPTLVNASSDPLFRPVADSALRAARRCAPLKIPSQFAPFYQDWKDLVVDFDPREMG